LQAAVPPPVERRRTQRLEAIRPHDFDLGLVLARDLPLLPARRLDLWEEQVFVGVAAEDEELELLTELFGGERRFRILPPLACTRTRCRRRSKSLRRSCASSPWGCRWGTGA